jgi:hypothetical protein
MKPVIIYQTPGTPVAIIRPTEEALELYGVEAIARKDVPSGVPYRIIDASEIPADRSQRDLWVVDPGDLTDGVGADSDQFEVSP